MTGNALARELVPPAVELLTAWIASQEDGEPDLYWDTVSRVLSDPTLGADPAERFAAILLAVTSLSASLVGELAGRDADNDLLRSVRAARAHLLAP